MKRYLLVSKKVGQNKEKTEMVVYLTLYALPKKMKDSDALYHPKKEDAILSTSVRKDNPHFVLFANANEGCLIDVDFKVNEVTMKPSVSSLTIVEGTQLFEPKDLYL